MCDVTLVRRSPQAVRTLLESKTQIPPFWEVAAYCYESDSIFLSKSKNTVKSTF